MKRTKNLWFLVALFVVLLFPAAALTDLDVYFLDVGQGDSTVIVCDGEAMIIDGGKKEKSDYIHSFLESHSISRIQFMIATHPHADHIGGLPGAFSIAKIAYLYTPVKEYDSDCFNTLMDKAMEQKTKVIVSHKGDKVFLGDATVTFLNGGQSSQGGGLTWFGRLVSS